MPGFHSFDTSQDGLQELSVAPPDGGRAEVPLVYGQIESAVLSLASETNVNAAGNATDGSAAGWSIQNNTNVFYCNGSGDYCFDQFVLVGNGTSGMSGVCIETWDLTTVVSTNYCVGVDGTTVTSTFGEEYNIVSRDAGLQAGDFGNVAAYAYAGADGGALIAAVGQFSWVSNQDVVPSSETNLPNRVPGLYAVVAPDAYGLANGWTNVSGGLMGYNSSSRSLFSNAEVATRFAASDCPGDVAASGPICPASPSLSSRSDFTWSTQGQQSVFLTVKSGTAESNNLADTRDASVSYPNQNLVVAESLSTTQVVPNGAAYASCLSAQQNHLFIRDFEGDLGGVPSNVGNVPYWESPDIFIVPAEAGAPDAGSFSGDLELTAGAPYNVYLQVHNDFGCSDVTGPVKVLIDLANPDMGFENWQPVTAGAQLGHYINSGPDAAIVPAYGAAVIGPFPFTPDAGGHKCILAAISADSENTPDASANGAVLPPAYTSNQIAQRNVQIDDICAYNITNSFTNDSGVPTTANVVFGISVTHAMPLPGAANGPVIMLSFSDPYGVWAAQWQNQVQTNQFTVGTTNLSSATNTTTVTLTSSYVALQSVPLPAGQSPTVTLNINPANAPTVPTVHLSTIVTDPQTGDIVLQNGGSCTSTGMTIISTPPK